MSPPFPAELMADTSPEASSVPPFASTRMSPPAGPLALTVEPAVSEMSLATRNMRPLASTRAVPALIVPALRTVVPKMPTCPASAITCPTFSTALSGARNSTRTSGDAAVTSSTLRPAARMICPLGLVIRPLFSTLGATRKTLPPAGVRIVPWLTIFPAPAMSSTRKRPERKSVSAILKVDAAKPATSTTAPLPMNTPLGLSRNTRPLDRSWPRICDAPLPTTRFKTVEAALDWMKRVVSSAPIEKPCHWMTAPGLLVICSVLPDWVKLALPPTTTGPVGLAATPVEKHAASAT